MGFYDTDEGVEQYLQIADGYDGKDLIEILIKHLPGGSSLLELGMGPGKDLDILKNNFNATGSDNSNLFLDRYKKAHPDSDLLILDAVSIDTLRKFKAIYSNKVLHHLSYADMEQSFINQGKVLEPGGVVFHSFWYGSKIENYESLMFYQVTESKLQSIIGDQFEIIEMKKYTEMDIDDSIYLICRLK